MELSIKDILNIARRYLLILLVATLCGGVLGYMYTEYFVAPQYTATAKMYVQSTEDGSQNYSELNYSIMLVDTYLVVFKSDTVTEQAAAELREEMGREALKHAAEFSADEVKKLWYSLLGE